MVLWVVSRTWALSWSAMTRTAIRAPRFVLEFEDEFGGGFQPSARLALGRLSTFCTGQVRRDIDAG